MSKDATYRPKFGYDMRVKPPGKKSKAEPVSHRCAWPNCTAKAPHKAPKSRTNTREYQYFCIDHIREFNAQWNFFEGMDQKTAREYRDSMATGHRPTWKLGANPDFPGRNRPPHSGRKPADGGTMDDPFQLFEEGPAAPRQPKRKLPKTVQTAFFVLKLEPSASPEAIKTRYKELVKKFHPDANLGEKGYEERLKRIIEAYQNLKSAGFC